jgi:hypothetical protein
LSKSCSSPDFWRTCHIASLLLCPLSQLCEQVNKSKQKAMIWLLFNLRVAFFCVYCSIFFVYATDLQKHPRETLTRSPLASKFSPHNKILRLGGTISYDEKDDYRFYGQQMLNAWILFVEWANEERGGVTINGSNYSVSLSYMDDFTEVDYVTNGFEFMLSNRSIAEGLDFMLSPYTSALTDTAQKVAISQVQR